MKKSLILTSILAVSLSSCATPPDKIEAAYVSPLVYQDYSCEQLGAEAQRVSMRASELMGVQKRKASNDAAATAVGIIVFWPALLFIKGKGANETEIARLKGQMDTIEQVSIQKQCGIQFRQEGKQTAAGGNVQTSEVLEPVVVTE